MSESLSAGCGSSSCYDYETFAYELNLKPAQFDSAEFNRRCGDRDLARF